MKNPEPVLSIVSGQPEPDPELERLLSAARDAAEPSAESRARVTLALAAALPGTLGTDALAPPEPLPSAALKSPLEPVAGLAGGRASGVWLAAGGAAIAVVGFWLGHSVGRSEAEHELRAVTQAVAQANASTPSAPAALALPAEAAAAPSPEPAPVPLASADRPEPAPRALPRQRGAQVLRAAAPPPEPPPLNFREVLEQLRRAREQLRNGQATMSLLVLSELDRRAGEVLREERETTRVLALCAAGQDKAAREVAARLEQLSPRSIYATRLSNSCVVEAEVLPSPEAIGEPPQVR
jgi:hypothetical protein